jgi:diguanylate cyclase (GGDEF)-like protein
MLFMSAAVRGRGLLVALAFPTAALIVLTLWLRLHGAGVTATLPAAATLIALAAFAEQINLVISPRMDVTLACGFVAAAGLIGGPLVGAGAGAATQLLETGVVSRKRFAWGGAATLEGLGIGLVGQQFALRGGVGALALAALGLLTGMLLNTCNMAIVALDRSGASFRELARSWRSHVSAWALPWAPLAAFLLSYWHAPSVALALAAGLLLACRLGNRGRLRLEQSLAEERTRARLDALTGAPNRYALAEALAAEHSRVMRGDRPAAVCFVDLDRFRDINNTYGYGAGDELLVSFYRRLRERLRTSDGVFRWGGEEFVVIAPDQVELFELAERIRLLACDQPFVIHGEQLVVTCSVGAARLDESRQPEAALELASHLVQLAKQRRNTVEVETSEPRLARQAPAQAVRPAH